MNFVFDGYCYKRKKNCLLQKCYNMREREIDRKIEREKEREREREREREGGGGWVWVG